jgi:hypothetical protein
MSGKVTGAASTDMVFTPTNPPNLCSIDAKGTVIGSTRIKANYMTIISPPKCVDVDTGSFDLLKQ